MSKALIPIVYTANDGKDFQTALERLQHALHSNAVNHGWWDEPKHKALLNELIQHDRIANVLEPEELEELQLAISGIPDFNHAEKLALMHSELSEALEGQRGIDVSDKIPGFTATEEELADVVIRILDYAGKAKLNLSGAIIAKAEYNLSRPYKHGGKKF